MNFRKIDDVALRLGGYVFAGLLVWLGLLGLLNDSGFTTVSIAPLIELESGQLQMIVYIAQVIVGAALILPKLLPFAKILAIVHIILISFSFITDLSARFDPAFPYLSELGILSLLELGIAFGVYAYLKKSY